MRNVLVHTDISYFGVLTHEITGVFFSNSSLSGLVTSGQHSQVIVLGNEIWLLLGAGNIAYIYMSDNDK